jgi:hypothetical protein
MPYTRDPVSMFFDAGARALLERAYAARGQWHGTRLADPGPRHLAELAMLGINPHAPDHDSAEAGHGLDCKSRWARGFVRALYYQHRWWSSGSGWRKAKRTVPAGRGALEVEVGARVRALGVVPAGRAVRVRVHPGGQAARKAAEKLPGSRRIYDAEGTPGARHSDPALRDW